MFLRLSILSRCSSFAVAFGLGDPITYILGGDEVLKRYPGLVDLKRLPTLTRGLRTPRSSELTDPFSLPGIFDEGEFSEAANLIGDFQKPSDAEPLTFLKEAEKTSEGAPKKGSPNLRRMLRRTALSRLRGGDSKESTKRKRGSPFQVRGAASKALEQVERKSPEPKKTASSSVSKDLGDKMGCALELCQEKRLKKTSDSEKLPLVILTPLVLSKLGPFPSLFLAMFQLR